MKSWNDYPKSDRTETKVGREGGDANAVVWHGGMYVQNEVWTCSPTNMIAEHTPIRSGTLTGSVSWKGSPMASFLASAEGKLTVDCGPGVWRNNDRPLLPVGGTVNHTTGEIVFDWGGNTPNPKDYSYSISYEYEMEDSYPIPVETWLLYGDSPYMFSPHDNAEPVGMFKHFGEFSPIARKPIRDTRSYNGFPYEGMISEVLIHYRIICHQITPDKMGYVVNKLNMVNAYYSVYEVSVPKGCGGLGAYGSPEMKLLISNDPRKPKPNHIDHEREHKEFLHRCAATDS